jgi:ribonuclease HIII
MAQSTITLVRPPLEASGLRDDLDAAGFEFSDAPYAFWRAKSSNCTVTFYNKGKVVLQGAGAEEWARFIDAEADLAPPEHPFDAALEKHPSPPPATWIGIDEAGKGDYFGPLVVVAAALDRDRIPLLRELGVADSKRLTDKKAHDLARQLKTFCKFRKVVIGPERYNGLYKKFGNLNRMLAWAHMRALEDLLEMVPEATYSLSDQFAKDKRVLERQRMERAKQITVDQRTKAEADPAVAVASILARSEFLWQLRSLGQVAGRDLPKGAGPPVLAAGREVVANQGTEILPKIAKLHFRTTEQLTP